MLVVSRSVLIAAIAVTVGLVFVAVASCPLMGQEPARIIQPDEYFELVGGIVSKDDQGRVVALQFPEDRVISKQGLRVLEKLTDLRDLDLAANYLTNDSLRHIGKLAELRSLNLFGNPIDSVALTHIRSLKKLETLYLYRTFVDDDAIESIKKLPRLRRLNLFDTFLTDKGLEALGSCKQLTYLSIGNTKTGNFPESFFSKAGIERLRQDLPDTEIAYWGENERLEAPNIIQRRKNRARDKNAQSIAPQKVAPAPNLSQRKTGSDWPRFLGKNGNGKSDETGINTDWKNKPPKLMWHKRLGTGYAAPAVANGRLLVYHRVRTQSGEARFVERLSCINSETGKQLWDVDFPTNYEDLNGYGDGPRSTPVIDGDRVYVLSPQGVLRCLQTVDGRLIWELDLVDAFGSKLANYGMGSTPVVYGKQLLVIAGAPSDFQKDSTIVSLDKTTGVVRYSAGDHFASYATPILVQHNGRAWCFAFTQDGLLGLNPDSGKIDFDFPWRANVAGCVNAATPVVSGNRVFISEAYRIGGAMLEFAPGKVTPVWQDTRKSRSKTLAMHWSTPILHEGYLYGCSGRHTADGSLKCISWKTGRTVWYRDSFDRTSLTFVDGHLLSLGENGALTLLKATPDGYQELGRLDKENAKVTPSYPAWSAPVVARGLMYLRGKQELICYDISSGLQSN